MRHCFRFFPAAVLLSLLVTACAPASSPDAPSLQATELGHGTSRTSVETQIQSGSLSSDNGAWLTLQVKNLGGTAILVTLDKDPETCITIEPGASGTLTTELSAVPSDHLFQLRAAQAGAELYAAHTLIQSTKKPAESVLPDSAGFPIRPQVPAWPPLLLFPAPPMRLLLSLTCCWLRAFFCLPWPCSNWLQGLFSFFWLILHLLSH